MSRLYSFDALKVTVFVTENYVQSCTSQHARLSLTLKRHFLQRNVKLIYSHQTHYPTPFCAYTISSTRVIPPTLAGDPGMPTNHEYHSIHKI